MAKNLHVEACVAVASEVTFIDAFQLNGDCRRRAEAVGHTFQLNSREHPRLKCLRNWSQLILMLAI